MAGLIGLALALKAKVVGQSRTTSGDALQWRLKDKGHE